MSGATSGNVDVQKAYRVIEFSGDSKDWANAWTETAPDSRRKNAVTAITLAIAMTGLGAGGQVLRFLASQDSRALGDSSKLVLPGNFSKSQVIEIEVYCFAL